MKRFLPYLSWAVLLVVLSPMILGAVDLMWNFWFDHQLTSVVWTNGRKTWAALEASVSLLLGLCALSEL